ncbi:helix-turn-helix domain-containing protein [Nitrospira sp. Nam74]
MVESNENDLLLPQEVAEMLRIALSTVYAWATNGKLPAHKLNGVVRFSKTEIRRWIEDNSISRSHNTGVLGSPVVIAHPTNLSRTALIESAHRSIRRLCPKSPSKELKPHNVTKYGT